MSAGPLTILVLFRVRQVAAGSTTTMKLQCRVDVSPAMHRCWDDNNVMCTSRLFVLSFLQTNAHESQQMQLYCTVLGWAGLGCAVAVAANLTTGSGVIADIFPPEVSQSDGSTVMQWSQAECTHAPSCGSRHLSMLTYQFKFCAWGACAVLVGQAAADSDSCVCSYLSCRREALHQVSS